VHAKKSKKRVNPDPKDPNPNPNSNPNPTPTKAVVILKKTFSRWLVVNLFESKVRAKNDNQNKIVHLEKAIINLNEVYQLLHIFCLVSLSFPGRHDFFSLSLLHLLAIAQFTVQEKLSTNFRVFKLK
jgi:hypothetical protein